MIKKEAKPYKPLRVPCKGTPQGYMYLTIRNHALVPTSGIDESNANGYYILWPKCVNRLAQELCEYLKKKNNIKKLAVIATDSHTIPLRRGVIGFAIGFYGLYPLKDYRGKKDIFGRELKITQTNIVDALCAGGVLSMGEGREKTPVAIARGVECAKFTAKNTYSQLVIPRGKDLYAPLLRAFDQK